MEIDDDCPTARMARVRLEELIAAEAEEAEHADESTIQTAAPDVPESVVSPVSRTEPPPSDRTVMMTWANNHSR